VTSVNTHGTQPATRRERVRAATVSEIKQVARRLLVNEGPQNVTLRAIAREMGMTAPGLYRYFPSYDYLFAELVADVYGELADALADARKGCADPCSIAALVLVARRFRGWAVAHPREFGLIFGTAVPKSPDQQTPGRGRDAVRLSGQRFGGVFVEIMLGMWRDRPFPIPAEDGFRPALAEQLRAYRAGLVTTFGESAAEVPIGAIHVFLRCWTQLYGMVAMEVFSHLAFCFDDAAPFFEATLQEVTDQLEGTPRPADSPVRDGAPG
jgi:AcrR family transcriptional regulator